MYVISGYQQVPANGGPYAVAIGMFDGVHRGHQTLLKRLVAHAQNNGVKSLVYTFSPHPAEVLRPEHAPLLIEPLEMRLERFAGFGVAAALVEPFDRHFAAMTASAFIDTVLVERLRANHIVVGSSFMFGAQQLGNVDLLIARGAELGFDVDAVPPVMVGDVRASSTSVRELIAAGDMRGAAQLLGRPYSMAGVAVRGSGRGAKIGFATANISSESKLVPSHGVYVARVRGPFGHKNAVVNIGFAPTFGASERRIEAHLFEYDGAPLYGTTMQLEFVQKLRDEQKFASVDALKAQIEQDATAARRILRNSDLS